VPKWFCCGFCRIINIGQWGTPDLKSNLRVLASTNFDEELVRRGSFAGISCIASAYFQSSCHRCAGAATTCAIGRILSPALPRNTEERADRFTRKPGAGWWTTAGRAMSGSSRICSCGNSLLTDGDTLNIAAPDGIVHASASDASEFDRTSNPRSTGRGGIREDVSQSPPDQDRETSRGRRGCPTKTVVR
jgi:hypothetical protein